MRAPGESKSDLWQLVEFSKRFKAEEVWTEELLAGMPEYKGKTLYEILFANGQVDKFPKQQVTDGDGNQYTNHEMEDFGFYLQKGLFEEYRRFQFEGPKVGHELADFDTYHKTRGLRWPVIDGKETLWRYRELLPVCHPRHVLCLGEGWTPLVHATRLGKAVGFEKLYIKDEGLNPTGSFKARGLGVAISRAS